MKFNTAINNDSNLDNGNLDNDKSQETTNKFFAIMNLNQDTEKDIEKEVEKDIDTDTFSFSFSDTEKEVEKDIDTDTFSFSFSDTDNKKTLSELKAEKSQIEKVNTVTIDKFAQVETLLSKMDNIDKTFIDFLNNQKEVTAILNNFSKFRNDMEIYFSSIIKNQSAIMQKQDSTLNAVNSIAAKFKNVGNFFNTDTEKEKEKEAIPEKVILRKKPDTDNPSKDNDDIMMEYFAELRKHFSGNFCYEQDLNPDRFKVWKILLHAIDDTNADTIEKSIRDTWSKFTKLNDGKVMVAKKSNVKFIQAMIKTIAAMQNKTIAFDNSTLSNPVIDKAYFCKLFNIELKKINALITDIKAYGKIDKQVISAISNLNKDISDHQIGQFINYIKGYIR